MSDTPSLSSESAFITPPRPEPHNIHDFRRQKMIVLILLMMVTVGFYYIAWLWRSTKTVNRLLPRQAISTGFLFTCVGVMVIHLILIVWTTLDRSDRNLQAVEMLINQLNGVLLIVLVFKVRNRLNTLLRSRPGNPYWLSGFATFFLSILYLQYKINRFQEQIPQFGYCAQCGYDLRGLSEPRCPECGTAFDPIERGVQLGLMPPA